ncbi:hypothetical protein [Pseudomonas syringae pv. coryli]|uniref:hypothetical protein n=1 Tax=Pseudomonas syringae pv. coryli TaxID=317659 RepID=UPI003D267A4D
MIWKVILGLLLVLAAMLIWGTIVKNDPEMMEKKRAKTAIELCREEQSKQASNPAQVEIIAAVCKKFESEYRSKYGSNP